MTEKKKKWKVGVLVLLIVILIAAAVGYCLSRDIIPWRRGTLKDFYGDIMGAEDVATCSMFRPELKVIWEPENIEQLGDYLFSLEMLACAYPDSRQPAPSETLDWEMWIGGPDGAAMDVCIRNAYTLRIIAKGGAFDDLPQWQEVRYFVSEAPLDMELLRSCLAIGSGD